MSTPMPLSASDAGAAQPRKWSFDAQWLREPLLHFVLLGGVLFAIDHLLANRDGDPRIIVVGPSVDSEAVEAFEESRGRVPNETELKALHQVWIDNEVLYREGLAMQVDKGDDAIRERVIFKALSVIDAGVKLPNVDDKTLRDWFESHRDKYDEPKRYNFEEAALSGSNGEAAVSAFVNSLNSGTPADAQAGLRVFKDRPEATLTQSYGPDFAKTLAAMRLNEWQAINTRDGWRAMRLTGVSPAKPANYDSLRGVVFQDWKDAIASEQRTAAVRALAGKYQIRFESQP